MRNQRLLSILVATLLAAAIVIGLGLVLAGYVSNSVNPQDPNTSVDVWRNAYIRAVLWSALVAAACAALWLSTAHSGRGLDTKAGSWYLLWFIAVFAAALIGWLVPPAVREGPAEPMLVSALLALLGYWAATFFMAPDQYRFTPLLGRLIWSKRSA